MSSENINERDLVLAPNSFAYVLDRTQGEVVTYVGPCKVSLADSDQPTIFDPQTKKFRGVSLNEAIQQLVIVPEGWYVIMKNPSFKDGGDSLRLASKGKNTTQEAQLEIGRKVNLPGPITFPLWPGQMAQVAQGHHLRSNQYLQARVYDEDAASKNRDQAVIKMADSEAADVQLQNIIPVDLRIGRTFIIKGTDISFFIPPTGIEIVRDTDGQFVREAETLELLEYCILLDESGDKRFPRGPSVVFPEATEEFVTKKEHRKFKAFELSEISGLYIKAIKDYISEGPHHDGNESGTKVATGTELFITGKTTPVYFPCEEHSIIQYGNNKKVNYAVAVPSGTGRYVLNRISGEIDTKCGPDMFLPDPRNQVMIRRILSNKDITLMYPGNQEALNVNSQLDALRVATTNYAISSTDVGVSGSLDSGMRSLKGSSHASGPVTRNKRKKALNDFAGDQMVRGTEYTPPRTLTLDSKYDGVVTVDVWTGFAVNVVNKNGTRRVVEGPNTVMLDYDESLEPFYLSRGTPKSSNNQKEDVYLKIKNNRVTDLIQLQTKDLVNVNLILSYRVNFEGSSDSWFNVDNYVALLTDHMRSLLRNVVQSYGIKEFWENKIDIIRDCVLGNGNDDAPRAGRKFDENGMRIYDLDFVDASIEDTTMANALITAQHDSIRLDLELEHNRLDFDSFEANEKLKRQRAETTEVTRVQINELRLAEIAREAQVGLEQIESARTASAKRLESKLGEQELLDSIQEAELERASASSNLQDKVARAALQLRTDELQAMAQAEIERIKAVTPDLVAAMQSLGHSELVKALTSNLSPLAILGGTSVAEVGRKLLAGTGLEELIEHLPTASTKGKNGKTVRPLP